jgi:Zn-dependent protease with chaperone function
MPNRYEREIEEILRNLEQGESQDSRWSRFSGRSRAGRRWRFSLPRRRFPAVAWTLDASQWFLLLSIIAALIAGGFAYALQGPGVFTGLMAIVSLVCLVAVLLVQLWRRPRYSSAAYGGGRVTPLRPQRLSRLTTRWQLFLLKLRYRRKRDL